MRKFVIDFYWFPIFVDWLVSTFIDNDRFLSPIEIIDMLRPACIETNFYFYRNDFVYFTSKRPDTVYYAFLLSLSLN